tara:strand:- start:51 stop:878 length:828 start_codon:yes stop_codon:yes gene_type:complete
MQNNNKKNINFFKVSSYVNQNNLDHGSILKQAYDQKMIVGENKNLLKNFIEHFSKITEIKSQLYQDVFASFIIDKNFNKTFLEFGATDGIDLSNTYVLEKNFGWNGSLSEPSPQWHKNLKNNRPNSNIITECIWSKSGEVLDFFESDVGVLSTISEYKESDKVSIPGNTIERVRSGKLVKVETISLNDVIHKSFNSVAPSYISIDTEGSEYEILRFFNFKKFRPVVFTIEHNFTEIENKIDGLMFENDYVRIFKEFTAFDAWYISKEVNYSLLKN